MGTLLQLLSIVAATVKSKKIFFIAFSSYLVISIQLSVISYQFSVFSSQFSDCSAYSLATVFHKL